MEKAGAAVVGETEMVDRAGFEPAYGKPGQIYSLLPLTTRPPLHEDRKRRSPTDWEHADQAGHVASPAMGVNASRVGSGSGGRIASTGMPAIGAGEGNRTLVVSLEGFCSTIELHPLAKRFRQCHRASATVNRPGLTAPKSLAYPST